MLNDATYFKAVYIVCGFFPFQLPDPVCHCGNRELVFPAPVFTCLAAGTEFLDPLGPETGFFFFAHKIQYLQCFDGIVSK